MCIIFNFYLFKIYKNNKMTDLNGTNNSDTFIFNDDKIEQTLNDLLSLNNKKSLDDIITSNPEKILKAKS